MVDPVYILNTREAGPPDRKVGVDRVRCDWYLPYRTTTTAFYRVDYRVDSGSLSFCRMPSGRYRPTANKSSYVQNNS